MDVGAISVRMSANTANLRSDMNEAKDVVTKATSDMAASTKVATAATADYTLTMKQQREAALAGAAAQSEYMDKLQSTAAKAVAANLSQADSLREQAKILGMTNVAEPYIAQIEKAAASTHSLSLANAGVTRELSVMAGEMARGNWTRFEGSMTVLANRTGLLQMAFSPMGALIAGVAAAVGVLGLAFVKGAQESAHLNAVLIETGNYVGMISGDFQTMGATIAQSTSVGIGRAKEALTDLAATGRISGDALGVLTEVIVRQSDITGEKLEKTAQHYAKMADGVAKWAEQENKAMHFMTLADYEHIKALEDEGNKTLAMIEVGKLRDAQLAALTPNLGILERAWKSLGQAATTAWDDMKGIGRAETVSTRLDEANAAVFKARIDMGGNAGNTMQEREANLRKALEQQGIAQADVLEAKRQAAHSAEMARLNEEGIAAYDAIQKRLLQYDKVLSVQKQLDEAAKEFRAAEAAGHAVSVKDQQTIIDGIQAQIKVKKESSAAFNDGVNAEVTALKLRDQLIQEQTKQQVKDIESLYKQGLVGRIDSIHQETAVEISAINQRKLLLQQELDIAAQKKNSQNEQARLRGEMTKLDQQASDAIKEDANREAEAIQKMWDVSQKVYEDELAAEQKNIDKIYEQTAVIEQEIATHGKSAIAIQQVTLAREQERASRMATLELWGPELDKLNEEIAARQKLIEVMGAKKIQEANDASARKAEEAWTHTEKSIEDGLYNAITEGGGSAAKKLLKDMENWFAHLVLQPLVQPLGQMGASLLNAGAASAQGGFGGLLGTASGASSLTGVGSSIGSAFMAGYSGLSASTGLASTGATLIGETGLIGAGGGGIGAGVSAALGAVPVAGWIALAGMALYSIFGGKGGGPKSEAGYAPNGMNIAGLDIGGSMQGSQRGDVAAAQQISQGISASYKALADQLGLVNSKLDVGVFYAQDPQGTSQTQLQLVGGTYNRSTQEGGIENVARGDQALKDAIALSTAQLILSNLQASDLHGKVADYIKSLNPAGLSTDQINASLQLAANAKTMYDAFAKLGPVFSSVTDLTVAGIGDLITAMGGMQNATASLSSYWDNFYTDAEKKAAIANDIVAKLSAAGLNYTANQVLGATRDQFRALLEQEVALGAEGAKAAEALLSVNGAFASITANAASVTAESLNAKLQGIAGGFIPQAELAHLQATDIQAKLAAAGFAVSTEQVLGASVDQVKALYQYLVGINNLDAADAVLNVAQAFLTMRSNADAAAAAAAAWSKQVAQIAQDNLANSITTAQQKVTDAQTALTAAYNAQAQTLQATITTAMALADKLKAARLGIDVTPGGGLSSFDQYLAAKADLKGATADNLPAAVTAFLSAAQSQARTQVDYLRQVATGKAALGAEEALARAQASGAQQQLDAIKGLVSPLISINNSVLSVRDAIAQLFHAQFGLDLAKLNQSTFGMTQGEAAPAYDDLINNALAQGDGTMAGLQQNGNFFDYINSLPGTPAVQTSAPSTSDAVAALQENTAAHAATKRSMDNLHTLWQRMTADGTSIRFKQVA